MSTKPPLFLAFINANIRNETTFAKFWRREFKTWVIEHQDKERTKDMVAACEPHLLVLAQTIRTDMIRVIELLGDEMPDKDMEVFKHLETITDLERKASGLYTLRSGWHKGNGDSLVSHIIIRRGGTLLNTAYMLGVVCADFMRAATDRTLHRTHLCEWDGCASLHGIHQHFIERYDPSKRQNRTCSRACYGKLYNQEYQKANPEKNRESTRKHREKEAERKKQIVEEKRRRRDALRLRE